jgi:hypothetical protein
VKLKGKYNDNQQWNAVSKENGTETAATDAVQ